MNLSNMPDAACTATLLRSLSDPGRLAILAHLLHGEHNVRELTEHLGLAQSTVSAHLACLRGCGLVDSRPMGRASMFSLTQPEATVQVLAAAAALLTLTGHQSDTCANDPCQGVA